MPDLPSDKQIQAYLQKMQGAILSYEGIVGDNWADYQSIFDNTMAEARRRMVQVIGNYSPQDLADPGKNLQLREQLGRIYDAWGAEIRKRIQLPSKGPKIAPSFDGDVKARAQDALGLNPQISGQAARPIHDIFVEAAKTATNVLEQFTRQNFPDELPSPAELARALADYAEIEDQSLVENLSRNLGDVVSKHANELGDRIRNPRPDKGAGAPLEAVDLFRIGAGGKGNLSAIRASHDAHARALLRNVMIDAGGLDSPPDKPMAVFDTKRGNLIVMDLDAVRREMAGNQPPIGPNSQVYPFPVPEPIAQFIKDQGNE